MNYIQSFDKIISLGSNCYVKMFLESIKRSDETHFFDYIGSSMWAINDLFKEDFKDLFDDGIDVLEKKRILTKGDQYILTHKKYHIRFKHEFKQQKFYSEIKENIKLEDFNKTRDKYIRRKERLKDILNNNQTLLFIRYEEDQENRIQHFEDKKSEIEYIYEFIEIIKEKYPLKKFCILLLSHNLENEDKRNENLIILKNIEKINIWVESPAKIKNTIEKNKKFIEK